MDYLDGSDADLYIALEYFDKKVSLEDYFKQYAINMNPDGVILQMSDEGVVQLGFDGVLTAKVGDELRFKIKVEPNTADILADHKAVQYADIIHEMKETVLEKSSYISENFECNIEDASTQEDLRYILSDIQADLQIIEDDLEEAVNNNSDEIDELNDQHDHISRAETVLVNAITKLYPSPRATMSTEVSVRPPSI